MYIYATLYLAIASLCCICYLISLVHHSLRALHQHNPSLLTRWHYGAPNGRNWYSHKQNLLLKDLMHLKGQTSLKWNMAFIFHLESVLNVNAIWDYMWNLHWYLKTFLNVGSQSQYDVWIPTPPIYSNFKLFKFIVLWENRLF